MAVADGRQAPPPAVPLRHRAATIPQRRQRVAVAAPAVPAPAGLSGSGGSAGAAGGGGPAGGAGVIAAAITFWIGAALLRGRVDVNRPEPVCALLSGRLERPG